MRSPYQLWTLAEAEYPDDAEKRRERYLDLMRIEGHIIKKASDDSGDRPADDGTDDTPS